MFPLHSGHSELSLAQSLQRAKCPQGNNTTEALDRKHFLHKLMCLRLRSSCFQYSFCKELDEGLAEADVDGTCSFEVSVLNTEDEWFVFCAARTFSTKLAKLGKVVLCSSNCLQTKILG